MSQIYFHHIPKTSGAYVFKNIYDGGLSEELKKNNLTLYIDNKYLINDVDEKSIAKANFVYGHYGYRPYLINNNFKSFTIIRDPAKRLMSHYISIWKYEKIIKRYPENLIESPLKFLDFWLENENDMAAKSNFQSKFLCNDLSQDIINKLKPIHRLEEGLDSPEHFSQIFPYAWGITDKCPEVKDVIEVLNKINLVATTETIDSRLNDILYFINSNLNIQIQRLYMDKYNTNPESSALFNSLSKFQLEKIYSLNKIDYEIWDYAKNIT